MHSEEHDKQPVSDTSKEEMQNWLSREGIPYDQDMLRAQLYALIKLYRKPKKYLVYSCLEGTEHEILRLPPYHACFNPIELAWGLVKRYFDAHVGRNHDYLEEMMVTIFEEALATVTPEVWGKICDKIEKRIIEAYETELKDEDPDNPFQMIISLEHDDDDDEEEEDDLDGGWETIEKSTHFGQAGEQENSDDPDDPEAIHVVKPAKKKKLTPVELACGVAFDDILPQETLSSQRQSTKRALFASNAVPSLRQRRKRSLFPSKSHRKANLLNERDEVLAVITEEPEEQQAESVTVSNNPEMLEFPPAIDNTEMLQFPPAIDKTEIHLESDTQLYGNEDIQGSDVWYYPVVSRAWWMIPARCVPHSELELAVSHIVTNGPGISPNAYFPEDETPKYDMSLDENNNIFEATSTTERDECHIIPTESVELNKVPDCPQKSPQKNKGKEESKADLKSLEVFNIPSRQVVDKYFKLIKVHYQKSTHSILVYPSSFFKFVIVLNKGDASFAQNDNPFLYDVVFIPVELSSLWCLCVVKPTQRTVKFFSAFGEDNHECLEAVLKFLALEHMRHKGQCMNWLGWSAEEETDLLTDHNVEDSPVLVCLYARRVCENRPCYFGTDTFNQIRQQMVEELKTGKLLELTLPPGKVRAPRQEAAVTERGSLLINREPHSIPLSNAFRVFGLEKEMGSVNLLCNSPKEETSLEDALKHFGADVDTCNGKSEQVEVMLSDSDAEEPPVTSQEDFSSLSFSEICLLPSNTVVSRFGKWHLTTSDVKLLKPGEELNDQVINMYLTLLADASTASVYVFPSHFYTKLVQGGHNAVKTWTKKVDIFTFEVILVPVHLVNHWALTVVNVKEKTVTFYDSMPNRKTMYSNHVFAYLSTESKALRRGELDSSWCHGNATDIPRQKNLIDCGVFLCSYARCLTQFCDFWLFEQEDMNMIRDTMFQELMTCAIKKIKGCSLPQQTLWPAAWKPIMPLQYSVSTVKEAFLIQSGRLHQRMACFPPDRRNTQCTAIATCAIIAASLVERPFSSLEMDAIVLMGDELYVQCRTGIKGVHDMWLCPDDIAEMGAFTAFRKLFNVKIQYVSGGTYRNKDRCYALSDVLQQEHTQAAHGYLFVGRSSTVSFWLEPGGTYLLFNSHCVSKDNIVQQSSEMGATRLFRCMTPVAVSRLLFSGSPSDNSAWSLVRVHVS